MPTRIFAEQELRHYLDSLLADLAHTVNAEEKNKLLNVNEADFVEYLVSEYELEPITLHMDEVHISDREAMVEVGSDAFDYDLHRTDRMN
jgi:hypothetical protein